MPPPAPGAVTRPARRPPIAPALAARARPASDRRAHLLPVLPALAPLFAGGGLRRGAVTLVDPGASLRTRAGSGPDGGPGGATTLAFSLVAAASVTGSWCAAVGLADPGVVALFELGVRLDHLALAPRPGPAWAEVVATVLDGFDVALVRPPVPARAATARKLAARARERRVALVVLAAPADWPEPPELRLRIEHGSWEGVGDGHGRLLGRRVTAAAVGRREANRPARVRLWLPGPTGAVVDAEG